MKKQVHILNGDALAEQLPSSLSGSKIICRECLVDGPVDGETLAALMKTRATFISTAYPAATYDAYYEKLQPEIDKILAIQQDAEVNLWFEDDLFCQVNMWWVIDLLAAQNLKNIFLVRPSVLSQYGFGGYASAGLMGLYDKRVELGKMDLWKSLWPSYQRGDLSKLLELSGSLESHYPFVSSAVRAYEAALPTETSEGRPRETLRRLINELGSNDFGLVFRAFCKEEAIYGYGDLQVRRMWEEIVNS